jgi:hypothetical protein
MGCRRGEVDAGRGEARRVEKGQVEVPAVNRLSQALSLHRPHHASSLEQRTSGPRALSDFPLVIEGTGPWCPLAVASCDSPSSAGTGRPPPLNDAGRGSPVFSLVQLYRSATGVGPGNHGRLTTVDIIGRKCGPRNRSQVLKAGSSRGIQGEGRQVRQLPPESLTPFQKAVPSRLQR